MESYGFGDSPKKNKAAVRELPIDYFGSHYFEGSENWKHLTPEDCAIGRLKRMAERRRLLGF